MSKKTFVIWMSVLVVLAALLAPAVFRLAVAVLKPDTVPFYSMLQRYMWLVLGVAAYILLYRYLEKKRKTSNLKWLETQSHELTHAFVGALFGRKIIKSEAATEQGVVYTSASSRLGHLGTLPMTLAPYCLLVWVFVLLWMRPIVSTEATYVFDVVLGVIFAFQMMCFYKQTHRHQTDIMKYPATFSYSYIYVMRTINILIVLYAFLPEVADEEYLVMKMLYPLKRLCLELWQSLLMYWHLF